MAGLRESVTVRILLLFLKFHMGFFPMFKRNREREGFRVGWFKRECYSEKLRESVTVRY